jgi:3-hydroxyisobutyrate dehydrogenase
MLPVIAILVSLLAPAQAPARTAAPAADDAGVRAALTHYLQGHATGDPSHFRKAFLPTAHIEGLRDGRFVSMTLDEYCGRFPGKPAADEATRRRTIDSVDVTGTAAMARVTLIYGPTTLRDYFVLLKVDGEWKIANKTFSAVPAP